MDISSTESMIVKKVLQTHSPDGCYIDPTPLLSLTENTIRFVMALVMPTHTKGYKENREHDTKIVIKDKELSYVIHRIYHKILQCNGKGTNKHRTTMALLELVECYAWNVKTVLVIAAVAVSYAEFALIIQLCTVHPLALSLSLLKKLQGISGKTKKLRGFFKALNYLVGKMIDVSKCIIMFESHHSEYLSLESESMAAVKAYIHVTAYWIVRSAVVCSSQITIMIAAKEPTDSNIASWELWSLATKLDRVHGRLRMLLDACYLQLEEKMRSVLLHLFKESQDDNQKVLTTLLAMKDAMPLRLGLSMEKLSVYNLRKKVVMLLISQADISPEKLLLLIQQLSCDKTTEGSFEVVWIPIAKAFPSTPPEDRVVDKLASTMPWYSICKMSILSKEVAAYIRESWFIKEEPVMVVLDERGNVVASDAIDAVFIWGAVAYPFSISKTMDLWKSQCWSMKFLMDGIDPTRRTSQIEEGKPFILYGGNNMEWIRRICTLIKNIIESGILLNLVYVGCKSNADAIVETISRQNLSEYLYKTNMSFFWLRLESMRRSRLALGHDKKSDYIMKQVNSLITPEAIASGWLIVSEGSSTEILTLPGSKALDILSNFQVWGGNVEKTGLLNSMRNAIYPQVEHCSNNTDTILPYADDIEGKLACKECGCLMDKHTLFQCNTSSLPLSE